MNDLLIFLLFGQFLIILFLSQMKNNKKLKKCNLPCPIYQKYGRCRGNETGKCIKTHDANQISLCAK